ncbi:MAG: tRNA preQ1(34) S-adenosylmethionine ribosyltransferase-isomerase QueA [Desulfobacteraceae bacterium]|jgi:S-adenosylmethionine:tRNA ribosyltransferase-isomerase
MFSIEDYNYDLPKALIAQVPASGRDQSRLLVVERPKKSLSDHYFFELPRLLKPGDLLVINNTRVVPARLFGRKETGGRIELLVVEHPNDEAPKSETRWCLLKSSKRPKKGSRLFFEYGVSGLVGNVGDDGLVQITFQGPPWIDALLDLKGTMPLPPYIRREHHDGRSVIDRERYQTVFSTRRGAVAAPTAGLHFTEQLVEKLSQAGISLTELTLHIGHGTFRPVRSKDIRNHNLGVEDYIIDSETANAINTFKKEGGRVIAVGTTVVRALETVAGTRGEIAPGQGKTSLLITPGFQFKVIDGLITNFHLPKSSLLFLVSAFAGRELIRDAYEWAIAKAYRFYSYGDAMLII